MEKKFLLGGVATALLLQTLAPCWADEPPLPPPGSKPRSAVAPPTVLKEKGTLVQKGETYTVVSGDTLSGIAASHGVSLGAVIAANPQIRDPDKIWRRVPHPVELFGRVSGLMD